MSRSKKKARRDEPKGDSSEIDEKRSISLPANPPRRNLALLVISALGVLGWLAYLLGVTLVG